MTETTNFAPDERFMRIALEQAHRALLAGEPPVGACIVADGRVVASAANAVVGGLDITAHAEMRVIREACQLLRALNLANCQLYATVEPCVMCRGACHYAGISTIVFGATLDDMNRVTRNELAHVVPILPVDGPRITLVGDCLRAECAALLDEWALSHQGRVAS